MRKCRYPVFKIYPGLQQEISQLIDPVTEIIISVNGPFSWIIIEYKILLFRVLSWSFLDQLKDVLVLYEIVCRGLVAEIMREPDIMFCWFVQINLNNIGKYIQIVLINVYFLSNTSQKVS